MPYENTARRSSERNSFLGQPRSALKNRTCCATFRVFLFVQYVALMPDAHWEEHGGFCRGDKAQLFQQP
jgi:hypothetical protein